MSNSGHVVDHQNLSIASNLRSQGAQESNSIKIVSQSKHKQPTQKQQVRSHSALQESIKN